MKTVTEQLKKQIRASWRFLLATLSRVKARVQDKLDRRAAGPAAK